MYDGHQNIAYILENRWNIKSHKSCSILECQTTQDCFVIACLVFPWSMCLSNEVDENKTNGVDSDAEFPVADVD